METIKKKVHQCKKRIRVFLSGVGNLQPGERLIFNYWGIILNLLKLGFPYDVIMNFSEAELNIVLAYEQAIAERNEEERQRQQRIANNG